jgi:hypothetical protein
MKQEAEQRGRHDVGGGTMHVFIWTDDANAAFARARELLSDHPLAAHLRAGFRNKDADEYTPLWPPDLAEFDIIY